MVVISQVDGNRKWKQDKHVGQPWSWLKPENAAWNKHNPQIGISVGKFNILNTYPTNNKGKESIK